MKEDIKNRADIETLVDRFYDQVKKDPVIGYIFNNIIGTDWSHHMPIMYQFWDSVLFNNPGYSGNAVKKHMDIDKKEPLKKEHYDRWLELWANTIDSMFEGEVAELAKYRANLMMNLISMKVEWARLGKTIQ